MTTADHNLADDETLLYETRQHWTTMVDEFVKLCLIAAVAVVLVWVLPTDEDWEKYASYAVLALAVILALAYWLVPLLKWRTTVYLLTTKRIHKREGFLSKSGRSIPLNRVNDVSFHASLWQRMWHYGDLNVESASEQGLLTLHRIPDPEGLKQRIYRAVDDLGAGSQAR